MSRIQLEPKCKPVSAFVHIWFYPHSFSLKTIISFSFVFLGVENVLLTLGIKLHEKGLVYPLFSLSVVGYFVGWE